MNFLQRAAFGACLLATASAHALSGSVTVHWDTLQIDVIDTNLEDGIAPTVTWTDQVTSSSIALQDPLSSLGSTSQTGCSTPGRLVYGDAAADANLFFTDTPYPGNALSPVAYMVAGLNPEGQNVFAVLETRIDLRGGESACLFTQPGVVATPAVPEPTTIWLLLTGLIGLACNMVRPAR